MSMRAKSAHYRPTVCSMAHSGFREDRRQDK
jgi:hypothetical protein